MRFRSKHSLISGQIILRTNQIERITSDFKTNMINKKFYIFWKYLSFSDAKQLRNNEVEIKDLSSERPEQRNPVMRFYR